MARDTTSRPLATALGKGKPGVAGPFHNQIDRLWELLPPPAKAFLLEELLVDSLSFSKLARFWSSRETVEHAHAHSEECSWFSWSLALMYLELGQLREAALLTLNGAFLHQCLETPIRKLAEMCGPNFDQVVDNTKVPLFAQGFKSLLTPRGPRAMQFYLRAKLGRHTASEAMEYIGGVASAWTGSSPASGRRKHNHSSMARAPKGTAIRLILVDGANEDEQIWFDTLSSTALRKPFNQYAEKRGVSLRFLRFSYNGSTLFLSSVGNKSPDELNMKDQDVITVHDTRRETSNEKSETSKQSSSKPKSKKAKAKAKKSARRKTRGKGTKEPTRQGGEPEKSLEEHKFQHSKMLSRLHEEVGPRLKGIRTRLNAIDLERQPPKPKGISQKKKDTVGPCAAPVPRLPDAGVGGRAGRPSFVVNVGEVQNLYQTTKLSRRGPPHAFVLDLHGHSRVEALARLNESLGSWVDAAMGGSYPFVVQVTIVCGCGNQILEEAVEGWIKAARNVGKAPNRALR